MSDAPQTGSDPFAPLPHEIRTAAKTPRTKSPAESWEPIMPAPGELPDIATIAHMRLGTPGRCWTYRDASGQPLFGVLRFDVAGVGGGEPAKETIPYAFGRRQWTTKAGRHRDVTSWHFKRPLAPVPIYGLDRLAARPDAVVIVTEGEKAADAAEGVFLDAVAVTSQGGSNAPEKSDWSALAGRDIVIWPDHDQAGRKYAETVAEIVMEAGATSVRIVAVPSDFPAGWDLADDLPSAVTHETLADLLAAATPPVDATLEEPSVAPPPDVDPDHVAQEVDRLSRLPGPEYATQRKRSAQALQMGVGDLDKAIKGAKAKRRGEAQAEARARPEPLSGETQWPLGVYAAPDGLYADTGADEGPIWLCAPIEVLGQGRDAAAEAWGLWLKWHDADGRPHTWPMPAKLVMVQPGELEAALVDRGLRMSVDPAARLMLRHALNGVRSGARVTLVAQPGWHSPGEGESAFVMLNGETIGTSAERIVIKVYAENAQQKMAATGTLEGWKAEIAAKVAGNPMAAFAVCSAFAGPLLEPLGEPSGGIHICGRSKAGKTLVLKLAISVWGSPKKSALLKDWRSTANGLEAAAEECNDGLLPLDEIHQADPKEIIGAAYQLANESGKQRLNRDAVAKIRRTWRTIVLSTGEIDLAAVAAKANQSLPAGAEVRLPSIRIDGRDMWPNLHGAATPVALMADLQRAVQQQHGTAIRAFLGHLTVARGDAESGMEEVAAEMRRHFDALLPEGSDPQVRDVARRCALIATAGEMAIEWEVLPWKEGEATACAEVVLSWWLSRRGSTGSTEEGQHVKAVRAYLSEFGAARFVALDWFEPEKTAGKWIERYPDRIIQSRSGYRRAEGGVGGADEYLISPDAWNDLCVRASIDPVETAKTLRAAGFLAVAGDGKNLTKPVRVPGQGRTRFYVVKSTIFPQEPPAQHQQVAA